MLSRLKNYSYKDQRASDESHWTLHILQQIKLEVLWYRLVEKDIKSKHSDPKNVVAEGVRKDRVWEPSLS